jgi:hypothetical protein
MRDVDLLILVFDRQWSAVGSFSCKERLGANFVPRCQLSAQVHTSCLGANLAPRYQLLA